MNMRTTKTLTASAAALALGLTLAACGSSGPSYPAAYSDSPSMWALTGSSEDIFRSSVETWNEDNPDNLINQ